MKEKLREVSRATGFSLIFPCFIQPIRRRNANINARNEAHDMYSIDLIAGKLYRDYKGRIMQYLRAEINVLDDDESAKRLEMKKGTAYSIFWFRFKERQEEFSEENGFNEQSLIDELGIKGPLSEEEPI
jgi:hypothetical protein